LRKERDGTLIFIVRGRERWISSLKYENKLRLRFRLGFSDSF
jgi:hypothetical protein